MAIGITITLTDPQEAIALQMMAEANVLRVAQGQPPVTDLTVYVRAVLRDLVQQRAAVFEERERLTLGEAFAKATPAERTQIRALLLPYRSGP